MILGCSAWPPGLRVLLFALLLPLYLATLAGNLLILGPALVDPALYSPMYFFLGAVSAVEAAYTLVLTPRMLAGVLLPPAPGARLWPPPPVLLRWASLWPWGAPSACCCLPWPSTATWPSATYSTTLGS